MQTQTLEPTTPGEGVDLFLRERSTDSTESTIQSYRYRLKHFVRWCEETGIEDLNELSGRDLHRYKLWREEDGDLNKVTLKGQMTTLRVFIEFCERIDACATDLHSTVQPPTLSNGVGQRDVRLQPGEAEDLLSFLQKYEYATFDHVLLQLLWKTGIRMGTARAFDVADFSRSQSSLAAHHRPDTGTTLKNGESGERLIALQNETSKLICDWIDDRHPNEEDAEGRMPLLGTDHGRAGTNTLRTRVYSWTRPCAYTGECPHGRDQADCEATQGRDTYSKCPSSVSPHAVRRGAITHYLTEDVSEETISGRMNVSRKVIDQHYDGRSKETKMEQRRGELRDL